MSLKSLPLEWCLWNSSVLQKSLSAKAKGEGAWIRRAAAAKPLTNFSLHFKMQLKFYLLHLDGVFCHNVYYFCHNSSNLSMYMSIIIIEVRTVLEGKGVLLTLLFLEQFLTPKSMANLTCKIAWVMNINRIGVLHHAQSRMEGGESFRLRE